ncbi:MAG TPA: tRNA uridine-5-carboxymethylaminomethyl(34) synthesis GTPase MnmE, partial [Alphaproteobacteria bacterium]|nr:tRNA uridine-5-carboxymethylaminomethyl(34) synthesis GTPase MnmE [Alphaproteobacteria bacterium]
MDTIYALSTAPGRAALAVVRISGPAALAGFKALSGKSEAPPRQALLVTLRQNVSRETFDQNIIDQGIATFYPGPTSYTGEDCLEYTIHGGRAVTESLLAALAQIPGHRMAEPGEFTRRAFENGKLDLTEAEAVADLIH